MTRISDHDIVILLSLGWDVRDIGDYLDRGPDCIKKALCRFYTSTGCSDRLELATQFAHQHFAGKGIPIGTI